MINIIKHDKKASRIVNVIYIYEIQQKLSIPQIKMFYEISCYTQADLPVTRYTLNMLKQPCLTLSQICWQNL